MEGPFDLGHKGAERTDINLWVFPHIKELLAIDLRRQTPRVMVLKTGDLFDDAFFDKVEQGFSQILRERTDYPLAHLIDLPLKVEELVRETGMVSILERLGVWGTEDEFPTVAVFLIGGAALTMKFEQVSFALRSLLGEGADPDIVLEASEILGRLIDEEQEVAKRIDRQELRDALEEQSPNFFTIWERRN